MNAFFPAQNLFKPAQTPRGAARLRQGGRGHDARIRRGPARPEAGRVRGLPAPDPGARARLPAAVRRRAAAPDGGPGGLPGARGRQRPDPRHQRGQRGPVAHGRPGAGPQRLHDRRGGLRHAHPGLQLPAFDLPGDRRQLLRAAARPEPPVPHRRGTARPNPRGAGRAARRRRRRRALGARPPLPDRPGRGARVRAHGGRPRDHRAGAARAAVPAASDARPRPRARRRPVPREAAESLLPRVPRAPRVPPAPLPGRHRGGDAAAHPTLSGHPGGRYPDSRRADRPAHLPHFARQAARNRRGLSLDSRRPVRV